MVSVQFKQERHNALVSFLMIVIAVLFLLYMGCSANGSIKAVQKRGITYKSLLPASMKGNRLEPSTRSPHVSIASRYAASLMTKFKVFNRPSAAGYMKFTIVIPFSFI